MVKNKMAQFGAGSIIVVVFITAAVFAFQNCSSNTTFNEASQSSNNIEQQPAISPYEEIENVSSAWTRINFADRESAYGHGITGVATKIIDGVETVIVTARWFSAAPPLFECSIYRGIIASGPKINFTPQPDFRVSASSPGAGQGGVLLGITNFKDSLLAIGYSQNNSGLSNSWNFVRSEDGKSWTPYYDAIVGVGNEYPQFVAANSSIVVVATSKKLFYSSSGQSGSWTQVTGDYINSNDLIWTGKYFVLSNRSNQFFKSLDGISWTEFSIPQANSYAKIAYGNNTYVLISGNRIFTTDSIDVSSPVWIERTNPISISPNFTDVHFANKEFHIVGATISNYKILSSRNSGKSWIEDSPDLLGSQRGYPELFSAFNLHIATSDTTGGGGENMTYKMAF